jgi:hypothetical protein
VRDPLLTLRCRDPVEWVEVVKGRDPHRQRIAELFQTWWHCHRDTPVRAADLAEPVNRIADPQGRRRQFIATVLGNMAGTRAAGFALTRQEGVGRWSAATYALQLTANGATDSTGHRDHKHHREADAGPDTPMAPMPDLAEALDFSCHPWLESFDTEISE